MRTDLNVLPASEVGVSYVRSWSGHRCDLLSCGVREVTDADGYAFENRGRSRQPLFLCKATLAGEGRFRDDAGRTHALPPGTAMLVELPSPTAYWLPHGGWWRFTYLIVHGDAVNAHCRDLLREHGHLLSIPPGGLVSDLMISLYKQVIRSPQPDELTLNIEVHRWALELRRSLERPTAVAPAAVAESLRVIEQRLDDPALGVDDLADAAGYSRFHFTRLFKQHTGASPYQALLRARMRRALRLLTTTDWPVKRISAAVGFKDVSWFCSVFKQQVGQTATGIRRQRAGLNVDEMVVG